MDEKEVIALTTAVVGAVGVALRALAKWLDERGSAREAEAKALREQAEEARDQVITLLRERISALEAEVKELRADSCVLRGCRLRRPEGAPVAAPA